MQDKDLEMLINAAIEYSIEKLVLFGSRAKGTPYAGSDYDILVYGENYTDFSLYVEYEMPSIKTYDLHDSQKISTAFAEEIERTGIVIYEKTV